jgi:hypothetical protein
MTLTIELPDEEAQALAAKARAQGVSTQQYAQEILRRELEYPAKRPLSERIRGLWSDMPCDVRAKLPPDGASQVDHYVYGLPKRNL